MFLRCCNAIFTNVRQTFHSQWRDPGEEGGGGVELSPLHTLQVIYLRSTHVQNVSEMLQCNKGGMLGGGGVEFSPLHMF